MKLASQLRSLCNISEKPDGPCNEAVATTLVDVPSDVLVDGIFAVDAIELRGLAGVNKQLKALLQPVLIEEMDMQRLFCLGSVGKDARVASWQFCGVGDRDLVALVRWLERHSKKGRTPFAALEELQLNDNVITDRGIYELTTCEALGGLRSISIANNRISNTGLVVIAEAMRRRSGAFAKLNSLNVRDNGRADHTADDVEFTAWLRDTCREAGCFEEDGIAALERRCKQRSCYFVRCVPPLGQPPAPHRASRELACWGVPWQGKPRPSPTTTDESFPHDMFPMIADPEGCGTP